MPVSSSLRSLSDSNWHAEHAGHLLRRAGFGGTHEEIAAATAAGPDGAVAAVLDFSAVADADLPEAPVDPDVIRPLSAEERRELLEARRSGDATIRDSVQQRRQRAMAQDRFMAGALRQWWFERMTLTPAPLQEKLTLLWHDHFAARHRNVRDTYLMYLQNEFFRANAAGNFRDLAGGIVRDPAMLKFLNNDRNIARQPNENLARELMELFTLGEGEYTEDDIKQGARALTGYHVDDNAFVFRPRVHDDGRKTILGQTGTYDGDALVDLLLDQDACARFVAVKLYDALVADLGDLSGGWPGDIPDPARRVILQLTQILKSNDYDLKATLTILLRSEHFYDPANVGNKVKSPVHLAAGTVRQTGCPTRRARSVDQALQLAGQMLLDPPSVAGWDGGRGWINTSTLLARQNLCTYLLTDKATQDNWSTDDIAFDPSPLLEGLLEGLPDEAPDKPRTPEAVSQHLCDLLIGRHLPASRRETVTAFLASRNRAIEGDLLVAGIVLITALPEFQLC